MAARSLWKGFLKLNLVSVPVKAYSATTSSSGEISLNQLHAPCNSRIRYKKTCHIHGEVPNEEIVSGYEYSKDQYVVINTDELEKLRTESDKAIRMDNFFPAKTFDAVYLTGKNYYLVPDGPIGQKAYQVICQGMLEADCYAIGQVVMHNKEQLVLLRPSDKLLVMSQLNFANQVASPATFEEEITKTSIESEELQLVKTLIKSMSKPTLDMSPYKDEYTAKLTKLIEAKVAGQELVTPPSEEPIQVINLMEALRKSVAQAGKKIPVPAAAKTVAAEKGKPPRKMAASKGVQPQQARKRKTS